MVADDNKAVGPDYWAKASVVCAGLLVVIGAAYSWFAYGQREAMKAQLEAMREQQRARISFHDLTGIKIVDTVTSGKLVGVQMYTSWRNSGTTPATRAFMHVNFQSDVPKGFDYRDLAGVEPRELVLGPNETIPVAFNIGIQQLEAVNKGHPISFWGWITYHDVFGGTPVRLTEFCIELLGVFPSLTIRVNPRVISDSIHAVRRNCYDQCCSD